KSGNQLSVGISPSPGGRCDAYDLRLGEAADTGGTVVSLPILKSLPARFRASAIHSGKIASNPRGYSRTRISILRSRSLVLRFGNETAKFRANCRPYCRRQIRSPLWKAA